MTTEAITDNQVLGEQHDDGFEHELAAARVLGDVVGAAAGAAHAARALRGAGHEGG